MYSFKKLVRFIAADGKSSFGELLEVNDGRYTVQRLAGSPFEEFQLTDDLYEVDTLLSPLEDTPIIQCIGINYRQHAQEAKLDVPTYPVVFTKPSDALAGPFEQIPVHPDARELLDYEGELSVIVGRDAKNVSEEAALEYVLGYTAGNDLSARNFQKPKASGGQFCYGKSFDKFAPLGHTIVSAEAIPDPQKLELVTRVNGIMKQSTQTSDMIWSVQQLIAHLSRGTTLRKGTIIMTGTPSGVGIFRNEFLKDGDLVEVEIKGVANTKNHIQFE